MSRSHKLLAALVALAALVGLSPAVAGAQATDERLEQQVDEQVEQQVDELLRTESYHDAPNGPEEGLVVFSADARVDGHRIDDELFFALGYHDHYPFFASLWLLVDADDDEWAPVCFGFLLGDEDGALFVGGSTLGDEDDGCLVVPLGDEEDDSGVAFAVIELEGESVLTAALYAIG